MTSPTLAIVVPCFNEAAIVGTTIARLREWFPSATIVVVDDGSTDDTTARAEAAAAEIAGVRTTRLARNAGKGGAIAAASALVRDAAQVLVVDADLTFSRESMNGAVRGLETADVAIGNRRHPQSTYTVPVRVFGFLYRRHVFGWLFNFFVRTLLRLPHRDTQCGIKAFRAQAFRDVMRRLRTTGFAFDSSTSCCWHTGWACACRKSRWRSTSTRVAAAYAWCATACTRWRNSAGSPRGAPAAGTGGNGSTRTRAVPAPLADGSTRFHQQRTPDVARTTRTLTILALLVFSASICGAGEAPRLVSKDGRWALLVDGKPFLMLGGQVHNSSAWPSELPQVWESMKALNANTIEAPIYWEQVEPQPGHFDWANVDAIVTGARAHGFRVVSRSGSGRGRTATCSTRRSGSRRTRRSTRACFAPTANPPTSSRRTRARTSTPTRPRSCR